MNEHLKGGLLIAAATSIFGFVSIIIRNLRISNFVFLFYTGLLTFICLIGYALFTKRRKELWPERYKWLLVLTAVFGAVQIYTFLEAYKLTTTANSVLLHYTAPIFAVFFAVLFLKEKIDNVTIISLIVAFSGIYLIFFRAGFSITSADTIGIILALVSGVFYGLMIICNKKLVMLFKPLPVMVYQFGGFIFWIPFISMSEYAIPAKTVLLVLVYVLIFSLLTMFLYLKGLRYVKGQHAGIISYMEVVIAVIVGYLFFSETLGLFTFAGGVFILLSGYMVLMAEAKRAINEKSKNI